MEIERKFLIKRPSVSKLIKSGATKKEILQTYLTSQNPSIERRIRRVIEGDKTYYYYTEKADIAVGIRNEREREITKKEYLEKLNDTDFKLHPIRKTRYCIPYNGKVLEIDIYPFLNDFAILEVELQGINDNI